MVLTVTEDTPADMLAGSMELLVQFPGEQHNHTQRVTVERSTAMMDLLVQIATTNKLAASSYTLQAIGEHGLVLPHQPNTPIGALDALEVKLLPKPGTLIPRKVKQTSQPFERTFRLQVHLPRNQLYVSRVSPKTNLGDILDEVCREKNIDKNKYELRHPANHNEVLDLSLSLQDYHLQEVTLYAKHDQNLGSALSSQDIMALQRQEDRRRQQARKSFFGFMFRKSKEGSLSTDSLGNRSVSPARSDETGRSISPLAPPTRPQRKRRPAPNPPVQTNNMNVNTNRNTTLISKDNNTVVKQEAKDKLVISHSRNSSDSSGYHEASVLSDNQDSSRMPETLPRRSRIPGKFEPRKLGQTSQASKSLCNLAMTSEGLTRAVSNTSLSSTGTRKKRAAPPPPINRPLSSAISTQALERIVDSEESLTSDMGVSKPPSDIAGSSGTEVDSKANSDIGITTVSSSHKFSKSVIDENERISKTDDSQVEIKNVESTAKIVQRDKVDSPTETELLLQKVSTTLSTVLPTSNDESSGEDNHPEMIESATGVGDKGEEETGLDDTPNATVNSQQDTSDYMSATGEDLSGTDWEYQLPDPPSAFRDAVNLTDNETISTKVETFTESSSLIDNKNVKAIPENNTMELKKEVISELESKIETGCLNQKSTGLDDDDIRNFGETPTSTPKIAPVQNTLPNFTITTYSKKKNVNIYDCSEPLYLTERSRDRVVQTFATLSRSKSTIPNKESYLSQKNNDSTNDFKTIERSITRTQSVLQINSKTSDLKELTIKDNESRGVKKISHEECLMNHHQPQNNPHQNQDNKTNVHRSKSYITLSHNSKYRNGENKIPLTSSSSSSSFDDANNTNIIKSTSITNLNQPDSKNKNVEKVSVIKNEDNKLKEKELQSSQVIKNILSQLKNTQQSEQEKVDDNLSKVCVNRNDIKKEKEKGNEDSQSTSGVEVNNKVILCNSVELNVKNDLKQSTSSSSSAGDNRNVNKRYSYNGPPTINLGSWSERAHNNVQIKTDKDYKLGMKNSNSTGSTKTTTAAGSKTIVNLNSSSNDVDIVNYNKNSFIKILPKNHNNVINNNNNNYNNNNNNGNINMEVLNVDTTIINNKSTINQDKRIVKNLPYKKHENELEINSDKIINNNKLNEDKPVVTVALKKCYIEKQELKNDNVMIDTKPVNFKELTQTFGQINFRSKPKYMINQNRNSEYFDNKNSNSDNKSSKTLINRAQKNGNMSSKPYKSIVDIDVQQQSNPISTFNNVNSKLNKISSSSSSNGVIPNSNSRIPPAPTMPVITGVTLKNTTRPKSTPICKDNRDQLMESIRNFGRDKLKSVGTVS